MIDLPCPLDPRSLQASWTWHELDRDSDRLARNLLALGLQPGDRVASLLPNRCITEVLYIARIRAGLVATPLNYRNMAPEIDHALKVSKASILVAHAERNNDIALSEAQPRLPLGTISYGAHSDDAASLEAMIATEPPAMVLPVPNLDAPAFIFFTSGSTGSPKGVTHTAETIGWIAASTAAGLVLTSNDTFLTASSLSHEGGVGFSFAALSAGSLSPPVTQNRRERKSSVVAFWSSTRRISAAGKTDRTRLKKLAEAQIHGGRD